MTGFAAVQGNFEGWSWTADMRAVNGRSLDLRLRLPDVEGLEPDLRRTLQTRLGRGNVTAQLKLSREEGTASLTVNDTALLQAVDLLTHVSNAAEAAGLTVAPMSASDIANMRGVLETSDTTERDEAALKKALMASLADCLDAFVADREREGAALADVVGAQLKQIEQLVDAASEALGDRELAQRATMERALAKLLETADMPDQTRLAQEMAMIAVKSDVTEELDRLRAHIGAARELMTTDGPVGRKLDFLMQEFNREANTLCSKAQSGALTAIGLDLKTVIDQMREQIQNIE